MEKLKNISRHLITNGKQKQDQKWTKVKETRERMTKRFRKNRTYYI